MEEETVFELRRVIKKSTPKKKKKKTIPPRFKRQSFSYNKEFLIFNEHPISSLKKGLVLRVNIPYPVIASFNEEFPVYGVIVFPFSGVISGKIKGIQNTNKALLSFDEVIVKEKLEKIQSFPAFLNGSLKESLFKDIALNFFENLPSVLSLTLQSRLPPTQIHFVNKDLETKISNLSNIGTEKRGQMQYLEFKDINLFQVVIK